MERLIHVYNRLSDAISALQVDHQWVVSFPRIVVLGSQSSGKSSVLESIVGRDFLPRGPDIITRCPLVLKLVNNPQVKREYGTFSHRSERRYFDFEEIKVEIEREMDRVTGGAKGISSDQISLQICGPDVPNLTMVDLPGLTKVAVCGQPEDISMQIRRLVESYIEPPSTIILAIVPANIDIANSDALKLASKHDPKRERTIGVLTKLDLVDEDIDVLGLVKGVKFHLKLGYVPVVNRSQQAIKDKKSIDEAMRDERSFFSKEPYGSVSGVCGYAYLRAYLVDILVDGIRREFPKMRLELKDRIRDAESELRGTFGLGCVEGENVAGGGKSWNFILSEILNNFANLYKDILDGMCVDISFNNLYGGSVLYQIIIADFFSELKAIKLFENIDDELVDVIFRNSRSVKSDFGFISRALDQLIRIHVSEFRDPIYRCINCTSEKLKEFIELVQTPSIYHRLRGRVVVILHELIDSCTMQAMQVIDQFLEVQACEVNYYSSDISNILEQMASGVVCGSGANVRSQDVECAGNWFVISNEMDKSTPGGQSRPRAGDSMHLSDNARSIIQLSMDKYFSFVKRTTGDKVSKIILYFLVRRLRDQIHNELTSRILFDGSLEKYAEISEEYRSQKESLERRIANMHILQQILNEM